MKEETIKSDDVERREHVIRRLKIASLLCFIFLVVEVIGGLLSSSLAILSDAAHLMADLASFAVAIGASYLASLPSNQQHTFGLKRTESLAAFFSMVTLAFVSVGLACEALRRLWWILSASSSSTLDQDLVEAVDGKLMSGIAAIGVVVNVALAFILGEHHVHMPGHDHEHCHDHDHNHNHAPHSDHDHAAHDHHDHHCEDSNDVEKDKQDHVHENCHDHSHKHEQALFLPTDSHTEHSQSKEHTHASELEPLYGSIPPMEHSDELPPTGYNPKEVERNVNLHAAYIHVLGDLAQSVAVLIAGLTIWAKPSWRIVDPIVTILFAAIVFYSTLSVIRASISILLEEVPPSLSWDSVYNKISAVPGVSNVHCLHIWSISHGKPTLSVHASASNTEQALVDVTKVCKGYGITHATVQIQSDTNPDCVTCEDEEHTCY
eukprot:scaffold19934_cov50-Attheya_sp.AAC.2